MAKHINLLPFEIEDYKNEYRLKTIIICLQIVIVLCTVGAYLALSRLVQQEELRAHQLHIEINNFDENIFVFGDEYIRVSQIVQDFKRYYDENFSNAYDIQAVELIVGTVPHGANVLRIRYNRSVFIIEGQTHDPALAESHREGLLMYYSYVWLGEISFLAAGVYEYELRIGGYARGR